MRRQAACTAFLKGWEVPTVLLVARSASLGERLPQGKQLTACRGKGRPRPHLPAICPGQPCHTAGAGQRIAPGRCPLASAGIDAGGSGRGLPLLECIPWPMGSADAAAYEYPDQPSRTGDGILITIDRVAGSVTMLDVHINAGASLKRLYMLWQRYPPLYG